MGPSGLRRGTRGGRRGCSTNTPGLPPYLARFAAGCVLIVAVAITACASRPRKGVDEVLQMMRLDQQVFSALPLCDQVRLYADVGKQFLDMDHRVALVPAWIHQPLGGARPDEVARCIADEGNYRLGVFDDGLMPRHDTSLAILTLAYKASELQLMRSADVQGFMDAAICDHDLEFSGQLVQLSYWDQYGTSAYYMAPDANERMKSELCAD